MDTPGSEWTGVIALWWLHAPCPDIVAGLDTEQ